MRTFVQCAVVAVCALTTTTYAIDAQEPFVQDEPIQTLTELSQNPPEYPQSNGEQRPCWSDHADPVCGCDEYINRSGLLGLDASPLFEVAPYACICEPLLGDCEEGYIWDYKEKRCRCVQQIECPTNYYFDYNTCLCECERQAACGPYTINSVEYPQYWNFEECSCECAPFSNAESCTRTLNASEALIWNSKTCSCDCVEDSTSPCAVDHYFSRSSCKCECLAQDCPEHQFWDSANCECRCDTAICGVNEYFDNESCTCRCSCQVCPEDYIFNHEQCQCDCLEPAIDPNDLNQDNYCAISRDHSSPTPNKPAYWSTESCQCECLPQPCGALEFWDTSRCECACVPEVDCPPNQIWDFATCDCRCTPSTLCGREQFFNTITCRCEMEPCPCEPGQFWLVDNNGDGECEYYPEACVDGKFWDFEAERCVANPNLAAKPDVPIDHVNDYFYVWDIYTETWRCANFGYCGGMMYWDTVACACIDLPQNCPMMTMYYSVDLGQCICRPQVCGNDEIFDYEECVCICEPYTCAENFYWDKDACDCKCAPTGDCGANSFWDDKYCRCQCTEPAVGEAGHCRDNKYWDHECCECLCRPSDPTDLTGANHANQYWDTRVCDWKCVHEECEAGFYFSVDRCTCVCLPHECFEDQYWNFEKCECECLAQACTTEQIWDVSTCSCKCLYQDNCVPGDFWHSELCKCVCLPDDTCETQTVNTRAAYWDYEACACLCEYPDATEVAQHAGQWFDSQLCDWILIPEYCPPGQYWTGNLVSPGVTLPTCLYLDQVCPYPYNWDSENGVCVCNSSTPGSTSYGLKTECDEDNHNGLLWNQARCECEACPPQACAPRLQDGKQLATFWNPNCCACQCIPYLECADGFDYETCACVVLTP